MESWAGDNRAVSAECLRALLPLKKSKHNIINHDDEVLDFPVFIVVQRFLVVFIDNIREDA